MVKLLALSEAARLSQIFAGTAEGLSDEDQVQMHSFVFIETQCIHICLLKRLESWKHMLRKHAEKQRREKWNPNRRLQY
jgi:hypothetical protein